MGPAIIRCTPLFAVYGMGGYDIAQRVLGRTGWIYIIGLDAWVR